MNTTGIIDLSQNHQVIEVSLKQTEIFSIFASVFSIILGILAITLSILFFRMSEKSSKDAERSSNNIASSVQKLETLFDKLYSGTFDMMKETFQDMRQHVYTNGQVAFNNEDVAKEIEEKTNAAISKAVHEIKSDQKSEPELRKLILNLINNSKEVEKTVKTNALREAILEYLKLNNVVTYDELEKEMFQLGLDEGETGVPIMKELEKMVKENLIVDPFRRSNNGIAISMKAHIRLRSNNRISRSGSGHIRVGCKKAVDQNELNI